MDSKDLQVRKLTKVVGWLLLYGMAIALTGCAGLTPKPNMSLRGPTVKILLYEGKNAQLRFRGRFQLFAGKAPGIRLPEEAPISFRIPDDRKGIWAKIGDALDGVVSHEILIKADGPRDRFQIEGHLYSGDLIISRQKETIFLVNRVNLEQYVKGVVPWEMGSLDKNRLEALKAQAVVSRTYAYWKLTRNPASDLYDLKYDETDQVYGGIKKGAHWSDQAVEETSGEILVFEDQPIMALFHSTCGGRTAYANEVFGGEKKPYLRGVADNFGFGDFCKMSPHYRWLESFSMEELQEFFSLEGYLEADDGMERQIIDIRVLQRSPSGRVGRIGIYFRDQRDPIVLSGEQLRRALGKKDHRLKSTLFRIKKIGPTGQPRGILILGAGFGHGVGMCQWGAMGMAEAGFKYPQILRHYYRKSDIKRIY